MKKQCPLEEIHAEIQRRIEVGNWADGYCRDCTAPTPYRNPFDGVSNWTATVASAAKPGGEGFVLDIVAALREECELKPESLAENIAACCLGEGGRAGDAGTENDRPHYSQSTP